MGVKEQLTTFCVCLCVHVHPLSIHIMYRMHNMFPLQICAHIQSQRPLPTESKRSRLPKEAKLMENERPLVLGQEASLVQP